MKRKLNGFLYVALGVALLAMLLAVCFASFDAPKATYAEQYQAELDVLGELIGKDEAKNFRLLNAFETQFGRILKFGQTYKGKDVEGAQISISVDRYNKILSHVGAPVNIKNVGGRKISEEVARQAVFDKFGSEAICCDDGYYFDGKDVFEIFKLTDKNLFEYEVSKRTGEVINAAAPSVVKRNTDAFENQVDIDVAFEDGKYLLKDDQRKIYIADAHGEVFSNREISENELTEFDSDIYSSISGENFEGIAVSVFKNIVTAYDYYTNPNNTGTTRFGITNKNNNGDETDDYKLYVFLHYSGNYPDSYDNDNAYFSGRGERFGFVFVGDGKPVQNSLYLQGRALDVIAHEYQHGVTSDIAGFRYEGDSGALDEAFSDIFGSLVEGNDPSNLNSDFWTIGENAIYNQNGGKSYLRSLISGTQNQNYTTNRKYECREHQSGHHTLDCDYNGVHRNSTIISHVQYELSLLNPSYFTRERIGKLWFTTLLSLGPTSTFEDFRDAFAAAAENLDFDETALQNVKAALMETGLLKSNDFYVKFLDRNGNLIKSAFVNKRGSVVAPENFPKEIVENELTYVFDGWTDENGEKADMSKLDYVEENLEFYASYSPRCRVTFLSGSGDVLDEKLCEIGEIVDYVAYEDFDELREVFVGWRTQDMAEDEYIQFPYLAAKNTTFVPLIAVRKYSVKFYYGNDVIMELFSEYGELASLPTNETIPIKHEGYVLEGWYLDAELTTRASDFNIFSDCALYSKWIKDENYSQKTIAIITCASLAAAFIIIIPIIFILTKRKRKRK